MSKFKCKLSTIDLLRINEIMTRNIEVIQKKESHELSEILVYQLFSMIRLQKRFRNKILFAEPSEIFKMAFDMETVLTLKYCLLDKLQTPGLSDIFIKLDRHIHPAIQLEL